LKGSLAGLFSLVKYAMLLEDTMLIINSIKNGDVVSLKLTSGEEVVGKLTSNDNNTYVLSKPVVLAMQDKGLTMIPYMMTADSSITDFTFKDQHVVHCVPTAKTLSNQYIEGTTGIKLV
jgi:small nuclear ribonucleoprotein (snRNP)-like protein